MKKNIFKKMIVSILSLSLMFSFSAPVAAASHAPNGSDIISKSFRWTGFSVRDDLHDGAMTDWEKALIKEMNTAKEQALKDYKAGKITEAEYNAKIQEIDGWQSYTEGWPLDAENTGSDVSLYCKNTGWDGEYAATSYGGEKKLVGDNPWGLTLTLDKIPVEYSRYYTMSFDISTDLQGDDSETGQKQRSDKYCIVKAYDPQSKGEPSAAFESFKVNGKEAAKDGRFKIAKTPKGEETVKTHIEATFKIPDTKNEWSGGHDSGMFTKMGIKFAVGAFLKTHEDEVAAGTAQSYEEIGLTGYIRVNDLKVIAGTQYAVRYYDGSAVKATRYVNEYGQAKSVALKKKGYNLNGYTDIATGRKFSFGTLIEKDTNLRAIWAKTQKPKKASFTAKSKKKKKVTVSFKKNANARGYEIKYSHNKKFKKKAKYKTKTKTTYSTSKYTIKGLKSSKVAYVKARAFNLDSCGNKVFGKWSKRKSVYVK